MTDSNYGGQQPYSSAPPPGYGYPGAAQGNGIATAGLVLGILAIVLFWLPVIGWILAILAIVFGGIGISKANKGAPNKGQAVAGLVMGIASIALYIIIAAIAYSSLGP